MRFDDERYVRLYTKDTIGWKRLPWQSRALMPLLLRAADRAGLIELDEYGMEGLADLVLLPLEVVEPGLAGLVRSGSVEQRGATVAIVKFLEAQEIPMTDTQRKREQRARDRARALGQSAPIPPVTNVTPVTDTRDASRSGHSETRQDKTDLKEKENTCAPAEVAPAPRAAARVWGEATGETMPDAHQFGLVREKVDAYAAETSQPSADVMVRALECFAVEVASWSEPRPLTAKLFNAKWSEVQARMSGKLPATKGKARAGPGSGAPLPPMDPITESSTGTL
jgi:hypothetical protein